MGILLFFCLNVKYFFLFFILILPLAAVPLDETQIGERIEANKSATGSGEALKLWEEGLVELRAANQAIDSEKKVLADLAKLDRLPKLTVPELPAENASLAVFEEAMVKVNAEIESSEASLKKITDRGDDSPKKTAAFTGSLAKIQADLDSLELPVLASGEIESARYQKAVQTKRKLEAIVKQLEAEQALLRREGELFTEQVRRRKDHLSGLREADEKLSTIVAGLKKQATKETGLALDELAGIFADVPELKAIVEEVQLLNERRVGESGLQASLKSADDYRKSVQKTRDRIKEQFKNAKRRIELLESSQLGLDDETGLLLRRERALPGTDEIANGLRANLERAAQAQISLFDLSDRISSSTVLSDKKIDELIEKNPKLNRKSIEDLRDQRGDVLKDLKGEYGQLNLVLTEGIQAAKVTIVEINEYSTYIDERLLWIKSTEPLHLREPLEEWGRLVDLFSPVTLGRVWRSVQQNSFSRIVPTSTMFLIALAIFIRRRRLREVLKESNLEAARRNCTSLFPTVKSIAVAVLLSLWFPLLIFLFALLIDDPASWHVGLVRVAGFLFVVNSLVKFSRPAGLFVSHFKMHADRASLIYRNLKYCVPLAPPMVFIVSALTHSEVSTDSGRFSFVLAMFVVAGILHHLFHPKRSILQKEGKSSGFSKAAYFFIIAIPVVFAIGASLGYFASVLTLRAQVGATAGLLVLAFLVIRFLTRWTLVSRRGLAISQALRRREVALAEREREAEGSEKAPDLPSLEEVKAEAVDVVEVEVQTTQLLRLATYAAVFFGVWAIWSSTLPALSVLDKATLWGSEYPAPTEEKATSSIPSFAGVVGESDRTSGKLVLPVDDRVSFQDLLLSLVFLILTFISARNIPSLLSLTLFSRINLGPGGNFALTTTVRYLIVLVGVVLALQQIGITWGKVQWLAAAITLGIGFGLQEIFANFVAGIILLFERPIRLGDVVTVGEISGKVTQIKIRATTIQQFNNRELLVPNKEFITSQLVNWTLKDSVLRFEVPVGIAYGSDTEMATDILVGILKDHPHVLDEPKPDVLFVNFGNSTLDFMVRGFVGSVEHLISAKSDLHYRIDHSFREAGIEIAFPQQDIHLRSLPEGMTLTSPS